MRGPEISPETCLDFAKTVAGNGSDAQKEKACAFILDQIQRMDAKGRRNSANIVFGFGSPRQRMTASMILAGVDMPRETWRAIEERLFPMASQFKEVSDTKMTTLIQSLVRYSQETWESLIQKALVWEPKAGLVQDVSTIVTRLFNFNGQSLPAALDLIRAVQVQFRGLTEDEITTTLDDLRLFEG